MIKIFLVVATVLATVASAFAQNVVGTWNGKIVVDQSAIPASVKPEQKKQMMAMLGKMKIVITLKADKTYTATASGVPGQQKPETDTGTWTLAGKTITIKPNKKQNGQQRTETMTVSPDGKTLTMSPPGMGKSKIVFKR